MTDRCPWAYPADGELRQCDLPVDHDAPVPQTISWTLPSTARRPARLTDPRHFTSYTIEVGRTKSFRVVDGKLMALREYSKVERRVAWWTGDPQAVRL